MKPWRTSGGAPATGGADAADTATHRFAPSWKPIAPCDRGTVALPPRVRAIQSTIASSRLAPLIYAFSRSLRSASRRRLTMRSHGSSMPTTLCAATTDPPGRLVPIPARPPSRRRAIVPSGQSPRLFAPHAIRINIGHPASQSVSPEMGGARHGNGDDDQPAVSARFRIWSATSDRARNRPSRKGASFTCSSSARRMHSSH